MYPHRTDEAQAALDHMPNGPYAQIDAPHLYTARYSPTGFEKRDIEQKSQVDAQGVQDNLYWYEHTRTENRAGR
jgi:hypothetical protein